jgi:hypothetical protein
MEDSILKGGIMKNRTIFGMIFVGLFIGFLFGKGCSQTDYLRGKSDGYNKAVNQFLQVYQSEINKAYNETERGKNYKK